MISKDNFFIDPQKRLEILKREDYKCFYCLCELARNDFYLDHLVPQTKGGQNYKTNLVASCRACNTKRNTIEPEEFLLQTYRKGLIAQKEHQIQKEKLKKSNLESLKKGLIRKLLTGIIRVKF